jgi:hypothetical protein
MTHNLTFKLGYRYETAKDGISIPTLLTVGERFIECDAKLDTGAEYCLFQRKVAEALGLDLEQGSPLRMGTLTSSFLAYGHEVTLQTFDLAFDSLVYFAADYDIPRNLLGRHGWLHLLRVGLIDYDEMIYLSPYHTE